MRSDGIHVSGMIYKKERKKERIQEKRSQEYVKKRGKGQVD